ncbi:MAG: hypothetical protein ACOCYT_05075 [Chloroflexota bacterium]
MVNKARLTRQYGGIFFLITALFSALLISVSITGPVQAQDDEAAEPTAIPRNDPLWQQFTAARRAIETERGVDLTFVRSYQYAQQEYVEGIDWNCDDDVAAADVRPVYFGFTWTITDLGGTVHQARTSILPGNEMVVAVCDEVREVDAGGDAPADTGTLPEPVEGAGAVGDFELGGHVVGLGADTVQNMQQAGMTWVKKQLRFAPGDSTALAQSFIDDAKGKGFKILLGIVGSPRDMSNYESYVDSYAEFVGQVAALGPDAIEVWNEPNIAREWPEGQIDGARYTELLREAYTAIKNANSNVIVISGAPAPTGAEAAFPGQVVNDDRFMQQMRDAGATNYFDCLGLHYNEGVVGPGQSSGDPRDNFPTRYYGTMLDRGASIFPERPVCWTELGYLSDEGMGAPLPSAFGWAEGVTVAQQAAWLAEVTSIAAQSGRVRLLIVWNVNFTIWGEDPQGGYAMMRPDGTCPACATLGTVMGAS